MMLGVMTTMTTENDTNTTRPSSAPPSNVQLMARTRFEYHIARLRIEMRCGSPRSNLEVLVRLCDYLVEQAGAGPLVDRYRLELRRAKAAVSWCADTRLPSR